MISNVPDDSSSLSREKFSLARRPKKEHMGNMCVRGLKYKLKPTSEQETLFRQFSGVCRLIYNLALEQRRDWYRHYQRCTDKKLNYGAQARELTDLRAEYDFIAAVSQTCQQQALRDLDTAYGNFFAGRADYPRPRKKGERDSFRFQGRECSMIRLNAKWSLVRLPKIGLVKFRDTRPLCGTVKNVTVMREANGWHIPFCCAFEHAIPANDLPSVGIDRGVANTLWLSTDDEPLCLPNSLKKIDRRKRGMQARAMRNGQRGSNRFAKKMRRVAALSARAARIRRDWHHKTSLMIARRFGAVALEDLKITNMTASAKGTIEAPGCNVRQKAALNRSILAQVWGGFEILLAYKLEDRGGTLSLVNPAYTSQGCAACGTIDTRNRKSQAVFECVDCGHRDHAYRNAAVNILCRNTASRGVESRQSKSPREAPTQKDASRP
jgi:putative transposase